MKKTILFLIYIYFNISLNAQTKKNWKDTYDEVRAFYESSGISKNYFSVKNKNKWGVVDKTGKITIPIIYDYECYGCTCDLTQCRINDWDNKKTKMGYINFKTGKIIVPIEYDQAYHTNNCIFKAYNKLEDGRDGAEVLYNQLGKCTKGCESIDSMKLTKKTVKNEKESVSQPKSNTNKKVTSVSKKENDMKSINNKSNSLSNKKKHFENRVEFITCSGCKGSGKCSNCKGNKYTGCNDHNGRRYIRESCKDDCYRNCKNCDFLADETIDYIEDCINKYCTEEIECDKCRNVDSYYEICTKIYCSDGNCKNCNGTGKVAKE